MKSLSLLTLLIAFSAFAQREELDQCLGVPTPRPSSMVVAQAWAVALAGGDGTKKIPAPPKGPCFNGPQWRPAQHGVVVGCN
ncbi:MAG: hypothetical protein ACJ790_18935, partial [Myxococcaceae bacterium]